MGADAKVKVDFAVWLATPTIILLSGGSEPEKWQRLPNDTVTLREREVTR